MACAELAPAVACDLIGEDPATAPAATTPPAGIKIKLRLLDSAEDLRRVRAVREHCTAIATGEMLTSVAEHYELIRQGAVDILQPDAPRVGGITQFLKLATLAEHRNLGLAPHFAMEIHAHLAAAYPIEPWVEHFDWLYPLFNERLETRGGRMYISDRPVWVSP
jgi:L-alanine-DL-glutamate epimerase-like enolase superfamily enzyme